MTATQLKSSKLLGRRNGNNHLLPHFDQLYKHTGKDNIYCCICICTLKPVLPSIPFKQIRKIRDFYEALTEKVLR